MMKLRFHYNLLSLYKKTPDGVNILTLMLMLILSDYYLLNIIYVEEPD